MALVEILYSEIYERLNEYSSRLRQNRFKMEAAFSAYEAKCAANDRQLKAALSENAYKQSGVEAELALSNVSLNEKDVVLQEGEAAKRLNELKKEAERLKANHEVHKQALDREFKTAENRLMNEAGKLKNAVREYLDSPELKRFAFIVNSDRALYDNAARHESDSLSGSDYISIGTLRAPIPVHEEFLLKLTMLFNYNFDAATRTIKLPACIDMKKGQSIVVEYVSSTEEEMLAGIRNFVLNTSRYFGSGLNDKREILLFQNFPEDYDAKQISDIRRLCVEAADSGNIIILTHNSTVKNIEAADTFTFIKSISMNIGAKMGGFFMEINKKREIAVFRWYNSLKNAEDESFEEKADDMPTDTVAVYIDGNRSSFLHNIITTIVKNTHPDDVELWLVDFGKSEFDRYKSYLPLHVRYLICDESEELVYDVIDRLVEVLEKRQNIFRDNGWRKYEEVPSEKYMPVIVVMINELEAMSLTVNKSMDYQVKLQRIFEDSKMYGFRFVLSGNEKLEEYEGFTENIRKNMWQYTSGKVLLDGVRLSPLCIMDREEQSELIASVKKKMTPVSVYSSDDLTVYIDKKAVIIDGNRYITFEDIKHVASEYVACNSAGGNGTSLLFLGEAHRMSVIHPVMIERESFENIAVIAPETEREVAAAVIKSVFESLKLCNIGFEIWGSVRGSIFKVLQQCLEADVFKAVNIENIRAQIKAVKKDIMAQKRADRFIVFLGFEALLNMVGNMYPGIYDLGADIRFILTYGPLLGYHFIVVFNSYAELERSRIPSSIFRHKLTLGVKKHSFRYNNEAYATTFRPFLYEGLSWDGWSVKAGRVIHDAADEEYLL